MEQEQGGRVRQKIRIDVGRFRCNVKQVTTPSEWIHKFTAETKLDTIEDTISR